MIGEPDAGNLQVRFDEGMQETCVCVARLRPTLQSLQVSQKLFFQTKLQLCLLATAVCHGAWELVAAVARVRTAQSN